MQLQTATAPSVVPHAPPTNGHTLQQLLAKATELGEQAGKGKDTRIKFFLSALETSYHGSIDVTANKHGTDIDDATKLIETYVKAQGSATTFDHKAPNQRKEISLMRTVIKAGAWPKGGAGEPIQTAGDLVSHWKKLRDNPTVDKKTLDDAANTFIRFCRALLKRDTLPEGDELKSFCFKPVRDMATSEERVEQLRNSLQKLVKGDAGIQDNSPLLKQAVQNLTDRLVEIAKAKGAKVAGGQVASATTP
jgi:hypothetical protein